MWGKDKLDEAVRESGAPGIGKDEEIIAFVGKGVEFKGAISYKGTVRIDGRMEGEIQTDGVLIVGEEAVISAKVTAGMVISKGKITGDVAAKQRVRLLAPATLDGSVQTPVFSIEEGVMFNGTCEMTVAEVHELPIDRDQREAMRSAASTGKRATG
jgi:cytoskeletal protein CcmA (bactofilin family)